jgi:hypothetical protein
VAIFYIPNGVLADRFSPGLSGVNADALGLVNEDDSGIWVDWDESVAAFPSADEINAAADVRHWVSVRKKRDSLLAATDFYALTDVTMLAEMTTYRQALRDLPSSTENSADVVFPTPPE